MEEIKKVINRIKTGDDYFVAIVHKGSRCFCNGLNAEEALEEIKTLIKPNMENI